MSLNKMKNIFKFTLIPTMILGYSSMANTPTKLSIDDCIEQLTTYDRDFETDITNIFTKNHISHYDEETQKNQICQHSDKFYARIAQAILSVCDYNIGYYVKNASTLYEIPLKIDNKDSIIKFTPAQIFPYMEVTFGIIISNNNYNIGKVVTKNELLPPNITYSEISPWPTGCNRNDYWFNGLFTGGDLFWTDGYLEWEGISFYPVTDKPAIFPGLALNLEINGERYFYITSAQNNPTTTLTNLNRMKSFGQNCSGLKFYLVLIGFKDAGYNKKLNANTPIGQLEISDGLASTIKTTTIDIEKVMILSDPIHLVKYQ